MLKLAELHGELGKTFPQQSSGQVLAVRGATLIARLPQAALGDLCYVTRRDQSPSAAQVIAFDDSSVTLAPFEYPQGISPGALVENTASPPSVRIPLDPRGCMLDALGTVLNRPQPNSSQLMTLPVRRSPPPALERPLIRRRLETGIRAIDSLCTLGIGQRIGLFASAGLGKSTLLGMIARNAQVDCNVIALIGERGREMKEFVEENLGPEGLARSVMIVATSDEPPLKRYLAALTATSIAEHFREQGKNVLLLVDSLTRMARALRDVGLAAGEIPLRQGFTSSVYSELPQLLERAGTHGQGSITGIYTVLTEQDSGEDALAHEVKSILDGHVTLSQRMVDRSIRPAIDPQQTISRLTTVLQSKRELQASSQVRKALARLEKDRDILLFGGTPDPELARALAAEDQLTAFLTQSDTECTPMLETMCTLSEIAKVL